MDGHAPAVIDGDTFRLGSETIRILNIDAPELRGKCDAEKALALAARDRLTVILTEPIEVLRQPRKDRYGRTLALIRVRGADVGEMLIAAHLAVAWEGRGHGWCFSGTSDGLGRTGE